MVKPPGQPSWTPRDRSSAPTVSSAPPSARSRRRSVSIRRWSCTISAARQQLFAAASRFDITFPDLSDLAPDRVADVLLPMFVAAWGPQGPFLPLLRAAATNRTAADALLEVFVDQVAPALAAVVPDHAPERAALVGSQLLGLAVAARYVLGMPPLTGMDDARLIEWLRRYYALPDRSCALTLFDDRQRTLGPSNVFLFERDPAHQHRDRGLLAAPWPGIRLRFGHRVIGGAAVA